MKTGRRIAVVTAVLVVAAGCAMPPVDLEGAKPLALRSSIRAGDGTLLARLYRQNRALVPIQRIAETLIDAVIAAEDARFFEHSGYDLRAIARAAAVNLREGDAVQGGSTITQQYVKNAYFDQPEKTLERKAHELRLALEIERRYSKDEILERYLNTVYLGDGAYGMRAAAETYFGSGVGDLRLHQAALLAGVIKAPSFYEPRSHPRRAKRRRDYVLDRMAELGMITLARAERAKARKLDVVPDPPRPSLREPYFVEAVKREILTSKRFGATSRARARALYRGGLQVETTLDLELQRAIAEVTLPPGG
jgi:penicillin-binding protein 1A